MLKFQHSLTFNGSQSCIYKWKLSVILYKTTVSKSEYIYWQPLNKKSEAFFFKPVPELKSRMLVYLKLLGPLPHMANELYKLSLALSI